MTSSPFGFSMPSPGGDDPNALWKTPLLDPNALGGAVDPNTVQTALPEPAVTAPQAAPAAAPMAAPAPAAAPATPPSSLADAISTIPARYGVDPAYITKMARAESSGNLGAHAKTSSAAGPYQIIGSTADSLGISREDRYHPVKATDAISRFTATNADGLKSSGYEPTHGNLYLSHFAGLGGARSVLGADPSTPVSQLLPANAVAANSFLRNMTAGDLRTWADNKMSGAASLPSSVGSTAQYGAFSLGGVQGRGGAVGGSAGGTPSTPTFSDATALAASTASPTTLNIDPARIMQAVTGQGGQGGQGAGGQKAAGAQQQQQQQQPFRVQAPRPRPFALMKFNQFGGFGR